MNRHITLQSMAVHSQFQQKRASVEHLSQTLVPVTWFESVIGSPGRVPGGAADSTAARRVLPAAGEHTTVTRSPCCPGTSAVSVPNLCQTCRNYYRYNTCMFGRYERQSAAVL